MSIKLRKELLFLLSFLIAFALYWPSMNGTPIWDDYHFWFTDPVMNDHMSYWTIWSRFGWPFSVSVQKIMLKVFEKQYLWYHLFNFILHCFNSFLVYKLGRVLRFKNPFVFFLLFLLHPVAVISTAWMVQMKTLLCFFFALASLLCFLKGEKNTRWMILSWILFGLSITSKSAAVTVPVIFLIVHLKIYRFKKIWMLIPFFILSGWNTYRVLRSPVTIEAKDKAEVITKVKETPPTSTEVVVAPVPKIETKEVTPVLEKPLKIPEKKPKPKKEKKKKQPRQVVEKKTELPKEIQPSNSIEKVVEKPIEVAPPVSLEVRSPNKPKIDLPDFGMILQTLHYYFWQSFLPIINVPVRGLNYQHAGVEHYVHIIFLIILCIVLWKDSALIYLAAGHFLLLPFIGIIKAPFMNVTWVSDQHLYLILPCFMAFWMRLIDKINWKFAWIFPAIFTLWFSWKTFSTTPTYKNQIAFYHKSLEYNPMNVPIAYNLAFAKLLQADINGALLIIDTTITLAQTNPIMMKSYFYPYILDLKLKIEH